MQFIRLFYYTLIQHRSFQQYAVTLQMLQQCCCKFIRCMSSKHPYSSEAYSNVAARLLEHCNITGIICTVWETIKSNMTL